jgi:predicted NBD/HSP70 family sugar kinase
LKLRTANASLIRDQNLSLILNYLLHKPGHTSRAELIRYSQLSGTTISALVNVLLSVDFVRETGVGKSIGGRKPITLELNPSFRYAVGIDIGSSHLATVILDLRGKTIARQSMLFDVIHHSAATLSKIEEMVHKMLQDSNLELSNLAGIGVSIPAPLEGEMQDEILTYYMPAWEGIKIIDELEKNWNLPLYLENDANAGAIAEKWWGVGKQYTSFAFIKLGIGVGSGLIINDEIFRGDAGSAGEIGHTTIETDGRLCRCGNRGCMESYVGVNGILRDIVEKGGCVGHENCTIETVISNALSGDKVCKDVILNAARYLGIAVANLINLVNPGIIIFSGMLMRVEKIIMPEVARVVKERTLPLRGDRTPLAASQLGDDVVAIGAATLVIHKSIQLENINRFLFGGGEA